MHPTVVFAQCGDMGQMTGYGNGQINQPLAVKRWVVERSFAWLEKCRRLWKSCECDVNTSPQFIHLAFLVLLLFLLCEDREQVPRFQASCKGSPPGLQHQIERSLRSAAKALETALRHHFAQPCFACLRAQACADLLRP